MKKSIPLAYVLLGIAMGVTAGCGTKSNDMSNMSKEDQIKAFKGDPSKIPADIKAKYGIQPAPHPNIPLATNK